MAATRGAAQAVRGRAIGCQVGTLIGAGWLASALVLCPDAVRVLLGLPALALIVFLLSRSTKLLRLSRNLPAPDPAQTAENRRVWRWFWLNLVGEIVLLNVAVNLLAAPPLRVYWVSAISAVVGLHFLPMARFFNVPSYWSCGGAMLLGAAVTASGIHAHVGQPEILTAGEAALNALILWATVAWGMHVITRDHFD